MIGAILSLELEREHDVVLARQRARRISELLGFDELDQTRISTAVSEMARNAIQYAGEGRVQFSVSSQEPWMLLVRVTDHGPGIARIDSILDGSYHSSTGMGLGILGARRLMDLFEVKSAPGSGTDLLIGKQFPKKGPAPSPGLLAKVTDELARQRPTDPLEEVQQQNQELLRTLEELRQERERLAQTNRELEETNRGVVALYAELDERADALQRANEVKTRFLSNMTHEFRTPLNSIMSLTRILIQRLDGELTSEQEKQVRFIQRSAENLSELVNDLLDLAKVEAGKILIRPVEFRVEDLFAALRGMLRPLLAQNSAVDLIFEQPVGLAAMKTDESKVSQILRNFISNALKYTERGEIRVSAHGGSGATVIFEVADTGIGIAEDDHEHIFQEYGQVEHPLQRLVLGTGLGLPLSRKLAGLLGGSVGVRSQPGVGSTFFASIPAEFTGPTELAFVPELTHVLDPMRMPLLVVEDNRESLFVYEKYLKGSGYQVLPARTLHDAREWLRQVRPVAIVLDILLEAENAWGFLAELRGDASYRDVPILVVTMVENEQRALALGANAFHSKPIDREWLLHHLERLVSKGATEKVLLIDDDEASRYILRGLLAQGRFDVLEATNAREGLLLAREGGPKAIFLDLVMQGMDGFAVLDSLKSDERTRGIPVIIHTSKRLTERDRARLHAAAAIVSKESDSREAQMAAVQSALIEAGMGVPRAEEP